MRSERMLRQSTSRWTFMVDKSAPSLRRYLALGESNIESRANIIAVPMKPDDGTFGN